MGKKRAAAEDRGDAPKRFKEDARQNGGAQRPKTLYKKSSANGQKQKVNLVSGNI
jgi:hypothetical protein